MTGILLILALAVTVEAREPVTDRESPKSHRYRLPRGCRKSQGSR